MEKNAADALTRALRYKQTHEKTVQNIQNQLANVIGKPGKEDVQAMLTKQLKNANSKLQNAEKTINSAPKSRVEGTVSHIQNVDKSNKNMSRLLENVENSRKSQLGSITHKDDVLDAYKHQIDAAKNKLNKPQEENGGLLSRIKNAITGKKTEKVDRNALESKIKELESGMKSRNDLLDRDPRFANQKRIESDRINSSAENLSNSFRNQIRQDMSESASKSRQLDNKNSFGYDKRVKQKALDEEKALYNQKMEETALCKDESRRIGCDACPANYSAWKPKEGKLPKLKPCYIAIFQNAHQHLQEEVIPFPIFQLLTFIKMGQSLEESIQNLLPILEHANIKLKENDVQNWFALAVQKRWLCHPKGD